MGRILLVTGCCLALTAAGATAAGAPRVVQSLAVPRAAGVVLSPDGRTAYVRRGVGSLGSLDVYARGATGRLTRIQCVARHVRTCLDGRGLETPAAVAVSPDGRNVYVAALNGRSVGVYRRLANGRLAAAGSVTGVARPRALAVAPDGTSLYVGGDRLWTFARSAGGALRLVGSQPDPASALAVTRDGAFLYSAAGGGRHGSLVTWSRAADGTLTKAQELCSPGDACAEKGVGLLQPAALAPAPDGSTLWVAATVSGGVTAYRRAADGTLAAGARYGRLPLTFDVAAAGGRVYVAYRDGLAELPYDLHSVTTTRLPRATGVAVRGRTAAVASTDRVTVVAH